MIEAISVTQLTSYIRQIFEAEELLFDIKVYGEICDFNLTRGVAYFSIKDENALMPCVCFEGYRYTSVRNGDLVEVTGTPSFYQKGGRLNFNVRKLEPRGQGDQYLKFLKLKQQLEEEGLFDKAHKKPIPKSISRIGVVTSQEGAVLQDIINIVTRRNPGLDIVLYPVKVQGYNAELEIVKGINFFSKYDKVDCIIVARGGGSNEDLRAFNTEIVARAVYDCEKPLISAVGHETDFTIIDFVADERAPTPSAAAELVSIDILKEKRAFLDKLRLFVKRCEDIYQTAHIRLTSASQKLLSKVEANLNEKSYNLSLEMMKLDKLNPQNILKLGYAKVELEGKSILARAELSPKDMVKLNFYDGSVMAEIKEEDK